MTKTVTTVVSHRFANPGLPVMMPLGNNVEGSFVWPATSSVESNFEFGLLGFI
jgi:hypothetical protein